jgi:hypothetical protein
MIANSNWPEIQRELNGQQVSDRPDLVVRVFHEKVRLMVKKIRNNYVERYQAMLEQLNFKSEVYLMCIFLSF